MYLTLFCDVIKDGRLEAILGVKKPDVEHVLNHFSDMHLPMLFNLGTQISSDGLHTVCTSFVFQIRSNMAVLSLKHVPNHVSDRRDLILFKCGASTAHDGIRVYLT